jgi:hypothetical protein
LQHIDNSQPAAPAISSHNAAGCSREHHQVERPPTVPCRICAPQRGQAAPARRAGMTSPVCTPPRAMAARSASRSAR